MDHLTLHKNAVRAADSHRKAEIELLKALEQVWINKSYYQFGCRSLFEYSTTQLKLSEELASIYNKIAKKFTEVPQLKKEMELGELSASKANRLVSVITEENATSWIDIAKGTKRQLEKEIAKAHSEKALKEKSRYCSVGTTERVQITFSLTEEKHKAFQRAQDLMSQKLKRAASIEDVLTEAVDLWLLKNDPLQKSCPEKAASKMAVKRKIHHKHHSQCTYVNENGIRCTQRRHLDIHHIVPRSKGGSDAEENLTLFCSGHHRAHHFAERME